MLILMDNLEEAIDVLELENRGLRLCLTKPIYKFVDNPEKIVVDATKFTWS